MATLQSTKVVMEQRYEWPDRVVFVALDPDLPDYRRRMTIDPDIWRDMGSPDVITVTIKPGDKLNGDS